MSRSLCLRFLFLLPGLCLFLQAAGKGLPRAPEKEQSLDAQVKGFLESSRGTWHDMNVPEADGRILYDLIIQHGYKRALEIGTSTGHSAIWMAWALSKTGGRLVTIEIDEYRYNKALENFKASGLAAFIDARLADAHDLVPKLKGTFDFVFCDAEKEGYKDYLIAVLPRLEVGGCFAAHNVSGRQGWGQWGTGEFYDYVLTLKNMETTLERQSRSGLSLSYKRSEK